MLRFEFGADDTATDGYRLPGIKLGFTGKEVRSKYMEISDHCY